MNRIRLIRHAESQANAGHSTSDPATIELTEAGWNAAREFAKAYDGPEPDLIVTSPYRRARQTAQPLIERFACRVEILEVQEFTYLSPARCRNTNPAQRRPMVEAFWTASNPRACDGEGAESFEEFLERAQRSIQVLREHDAATILVFTHEFFINAVRFFDLPEKPSATPESMRQFHEFSRQNPVANLGIHDLANLPKIFGNPSGRSKPAKTADEPTGIDQLVAAAIAFSNGDGLGDLFKFIGRTRVHAPYNAMLLHIQKPESRLMLSKAGWEKIGRAVKQGARPYVVLSTMGPVAFVFDEEETDGTPVDIEKYSNLHWDSFAVRGELRPKAWERLVNSCEKIGIEVDEKGGKLWKAGEIALENCFCRVQLNSNHPLEVRFNTLAHELAHLFLGHLGAFHGISQDRTNLASATFEVEAEITAALVCQRSGIHPESHRYIARYLRQKPDFSVDAILVAAGKIEAMALGRFRPKKAIFKRDIKNPKISPPQHDIQASATRLSSTR